MVSKKFVSLLFGLMFLLLAACQPQEEENQNKLEVLLKSLK